MLGVIRWVVIVLLFYLIYQVLKGWVLPRDKKEAAHPAAPGEGDQAQELVRDPQCGVYFPKSEGVASLVDGQVLYFHNAECRDKYLAGRGK